MATFGYARISRKQQNIQRQIRNILAYDPNAKIYEEAYTGTTSARPEWQKLLKILKAGDKLVFDSVSRMSRDAATGIETYFELFDRGVELVFLKENYINTETYRAALNDKIELTGTDEDEIFIGLNNYFRKLAKRQIQIAFDQAQKEVDDLHERTREGIQTARISGKQIGGVPGSKYNVKKSAMAKEEIKKNLARGLKDTEIMKLVALSRNTYYKYKREINEGD